MSNDPKPVGAICGCPWTYLEYVTWECSPGWFEGRITCRNCKKWTGASPAQGVLLAAIQDLYKTMQHELDELKAKIPCERCDGVGNLGEDLSCMTCPDCGGSGSLLPRETDDDE